MQDRIPVNPGRVLISPENGSPYYATMTRADNATQEGTPLNKNSLFRDATAALFGLGADAVPDDAFTLLSRFQNGLGNEYVWAKVSVTWKRVSSSINMNPVSAMNSSTTAYSGIEVATEYVINNDGTFSLSGDKAQITSSYNDVQGNPPSLNSYIGYFALTGNGKYLCEITSSTYAMRTSSGSGAAATYGWFLNDTTKYEAISETENIGYVNSFDPNAYPVDDGYVYTALGQFGAKVQIATGSYAGTGTYGSTNQNSLKIGFVPKMVFVTCATYSINRTLWAHFYAPLRNGFVVMADGNGNPNLSGRATSYCTWGETFTFYNTGGTNHQMNESGVVYHYIAIG